MDQYTAFAGNRRLATGSLIDVALAVKRAGSACLTFNDSTGGEVDFDTRGTDDELVARLSDTEPKRAPGRPKLGVVPREVTLLPRHWEWLNAQRGGASAALRRLIDEARRADDPKGRTRAAHEAAYNFMSAIAGNLPGFEEAARALFADDRARFDQLVAEWPADVRAHATKLGFERG